MLAFSVCVFEDDEKMFEFYHNYVNERFKKELLYAIKTYEGLRSSHGKKRAENYIRALFPRYVPENYIDTQGIHDLKGLYSLLMSDKCYVPILTMEYSLARLLGNMIEEDEGAPTDKEVITAEIKKKMIALNLDWYRSNVDKNYSRKEAEKYIENLVRASDEWFNFCFWDMDYELLDMATIRSPGAIRNTNLNDLANILPDDASDEDFFLPDDWENSKDFHFLHEDAEEALVGCDDGECDG